MTRTVALSRLDIDESTDLRREPARLPKDRQPGFEQQFDHHTVFYDCFTAEDGRRAICLGPPLLNLEPLVLAAAERAFWPQSFARSQVRSLDRDCQIWFTPPASSVAFDNDAFKQRTLAIQPNHCDWFRGKRVLVTKSKDNALTWIRDWVHFHVANHGCNAVLLYDNASSRYGIEDVRRTLSSVAGLDVVVAVEWPYKFGPNAGPSQIWDSDFSQYGALEHAHHRFLAKADAVLNADIDELVVTQTGESIFDLVRRSRTGYLAYAGVMIENASDLNRGDARRHCDYMYHRTPPAPATVKWVLSPPRCPEHAQWCVHLVTEMQPDENLSGLVAHRHFAAITTNWKSRRWVVERPGATYALDQELAQWMQCFS